MDYLFEKNLQSFEIEESLVQLLFKVFANILLDAISLREVGCV